MEHPIYDKKDVLSRFDGDEKLCQEVLEMFIQAFPMHLRQLEKSFQREEWKEVSQHAHSIKGAAGNIGAKALAQVAYQLEQAMQTGQENVLPGLLQKIKQEYRALQGLMSQNLGNRPS